MAWTYLAESPKPWKATSNQLPIVKSSPMLEVSFFREWQTEASPSPQYGMTLQRLLALRYPGLTLSMGVSHAKISAPRDVERVWKESEADYFSRSCGWPKKSDPRSYSLKTVRLSGRGGLALSLTNYPASGMIVDGVCWPLKMWERYTKGSGGFCLPTPLAGHAGRLISKPTPMEVRMGRSKDTATWIYNNFPIFAGKHLSPTFWERLMGYRTGWTAIEPWAMPSSQHRRGKHLNA